MSPNLVTPVQGVAGASPGTESSTTTAEARALNRSLSAAVQTVNDSGYLGSGRELTFSVDHATKVPVIRVVDTSTNEVVEQWPPQYLLQVAADSQKTRDSG